MKWGFFKKSIYGSLKGQSGSAGSLRVLWLLLALCMLFIQLSAETQTDSAPLPEWLQLPKMQIQQPDNSTPLLIQLADRLEIWDQWSLKVEVWYQKLLTSVNLMRISFDELEQRQKKALEAKNNIIAAQQAEIALLRGQLSKSTDGKILFGVGGLFTGLAGGIVIMAIVK